MITSSRAVAVFAVCGLILAGCGNPNVRPVANSEYFSNSTNATSSDNGPGLLGDGGLTLGIGGKRTDPASGDGGAGIGVNAYLWRATLDTLSFMPLVSADPMGGVIITDWWQTGTAPKERFKATAYILSRRLRSDGIKVSLFRQVEQQWPMGRYPGECDHARRARGQDHRAGPRIAGALRTELAGRYQAEAGSAALVERNCRAFKTSAPVRLPCRRSPSGPLITPYAAS